MSNSHSQANQPKTNQTYLLLIAATAASGGFLFGYDTAVISGTIGFVKETFALDSVMEGWFVSSALVGCIAGVAVTGELSDRFGRKPSLIASGLLFSISAIGCALSASHTELIVYRLVGGIGVGMASMLAPLYISEVSPAHIRGRMVALYQFAITIGILTAYFANAYFLHLSESLTSFSSDSLGHRLFVAEVWRAMFGSETIPAVLFFLAMFFVPSSPRWLASKNKSEIAKQVLQRINNQAIAEKELEAINTAIASESDGSWSVLLQKGLRLSVFAGIGLALLSQFTGINAIIYYGPRIMEEAGMKLSDALGSQIVIGLVNVVATIYAIWKIDQFGRKKLMQGGVAGMFLSLIGIGVLFLALSENTGPNSLASSDSEKSAEFTSLEDSDNGSGSRKSDFSDKTLYEKTVSFGLLIFILTFITSFAIGYGPVIWVLLSEIYPTKIRGRAMSVAVLTLWIGTAIVAQVFPWMQEKLSPAGTFFVFAACCIPVPFILGQIPETKGMSLEEIEEMWRDRE